MNLSTPKRSAFRRRSTTCLLTATVAAIGVGGLVAAPAAAATPAGVSAELTMNAASNWYQSGSFTVSNDSDAPSDWSIRLNVPNGTFANNAAWMTDTAVDDSQVVVSSQHPLAVGASAVVSFGIAGNGTVALSPEACDVNGQPITGCSTDDAPAPVEGSEDASEQGAGDAGEELPVDVPGDAQQPPLGLSIDAHRSLVSVQALGDARTIAAQNDLASPHTDLQPTGRFVTAGERITVVVPEGATGLQAAVGLHGNYWDINRCIDVGMQLTELTPGSTEIVAPHDGLVYLQHTGTGTTADVTVTGGSPVPTFIAGETSRDEFDAQLAEWNAPMFTLVGDRVLADFQRAASFAGSSFSNEAALAGIDLDARVASWDAGVVLNDEYFGLDAAATAHRVHIVAPSHAGAPAHGAVAAWDGYLKSPSSNVGHSQLLDPVTNRALWSAVADTYGTSLFAWNAPIGTQMARSGAALDGSAGFNGFSSASHQKNAETLRKESYHAYASYSSWVRGSAGLNTGGLVFEQLDWAFGDDFVTELIQEHRASGAASASVDDFARAASAKAGHDLAPHFAAWELPLSAETKAELGKLPALDDSIWTVYAAKG
ncbi:hypothetical protein KXS11_00960 [Plantibacter flavus]|uniref:M60 family peptidase N-terminal accessory domain-containing protein n=1 Tax=Plantibacter flavus TaxID=150123 RepID=UPI003F13F65F